MTLYEIKAEYLNALDNLEVDEDGVVTNYDDLEAVEGLFIEKAEAVGLYLKNLDAESAAIDAEIKALRERKAAKDRKAENLRDYLAINLQAAGKQLVETSKIRLSFRKSVRVVVDDEAELPAEYVTTKVSTAPDKTAIKDAIKAGATIPGARLEEYQNLQIK